MKKFIDGGLKMKKISSYINVCCSNKVFVASLISILSYLTLIMSSIIGSYDLYSWIILVLLFICFYKSKLYDKNCFKATLIFSIIFSFIMIFGKQVYALQDNNYLSIWDGLLTFKNTLIFLGNMSLIYVILINILLVMINYKNKVNKKEKKRWSNKKVFIVSAIIILLGWLPYYLALFPGTVSPDSIGELTIITNGFVSISDHHPIVHVLFMTLPYNLGKFVFGSPNAGVALISIFQSVIMASIFAYSVLFLYKRKISSILLVGLLGFYTLFPMHGFYSVVMWKDVLFAGMFLLFTIECIKLVENYKNNNINFKNLISFVIVSILCIFFRNNAVYMYVLLSIVTLIMMKKYFKILLITFSIVLGTYLVVKGPIFNLLDVQKSSSSEYIGMPLQQIGRMAFKDAKFNDKQTKLLNELMSIEKMKEQYNPRVSDGIKFSKHYNVEVFDENKLDYAKLWLELVIEYPAVAVEAYANSTLGYWYPNVMYWSVANNIWENELGIYEDSLLPENVKSKILSIEDRNRPLIAISWSIGLWFWILSLLIYIAIKRGKLISVYPLLPSVGIWITMMVASPVFGEFRYVYCVISTIPLLLMYCLDLKKVKKR